jgi:hypothetical protein
MDLERSLARESGQTRNDITRSEGDVNGEGGVQQACGLQWLSVPLRGDRELRRWYSDGGDACLVRTDRGELLEPFPTFGPRVYRRLARRASFEEANAYAWKHGFTHARDRVG